MQNKLIPTVLQEADIRENGEGVDQNVLLEVVKVEENQFTVLMSGDTLLNKYFK